MRHCLCTHPSIAHSPKGAHPCAVCGCGVFIAKSQREREASTAIDVLEAMLLALVITAVLIVLI